VRGAGAPDVFPVAEPRLHDSMASLYGLADPTVDGLAAVAARWSPYRSWVSVLIRTDRERRGEVGHPVDMPIPRRAPRRRWSPARVG
jgi:3-methyladenine DNA glycosylase/8-oxoguanine DNA glycosylase